MPFDNQIATISSSQLDQLFESVPDTTVNANTVAVGKQDDTTTTEVENKGVEFVTKTNDQIPFADDSLFVDPSAEEDKTDDKVDDNTKVDETKSDEDAAKTDDKEKDKSEEDKAAPDLTQVNSVLKNTVEYLISSGQWADFEGREDLEVTQEVYAELAAKQNQHVAYELVNELIDSTGAYGKAIINHIKNGGNADEIIDLFKEQKSIEQIDTTTEQGKQLKIEKYYKDVLQWKPEKVAKTVKRLVEDNEIDVEFADVEELYNKHYEARLAETQAETNRIQKENKERQEAFVNNIKSTLEQDTTLTSTDKKRIASSILDFKHKLDNGQKVNDFYLKFAEMQKDPKKYIKLVNFVLDDETYDKRIQKVESSKEAAAAFNFIKGNAAKSTTKAASIEVTNTGKTEKHTGTNFSFALKK